MLSVFLGSSTALWDLRAGGIDESCETTQSLHALSMLRESAVLLSLLAKYHPSIRHALPRPDVISAIVSILRTAPFDIQEHCISAVGDMALHGALLG